MTSTIEGWGRPVNSQKFHWFRKGMAICGGWMYTGPISPDPEVKASPKDCVKCSRLLAKETQQTKAKEQAVTPDRAALVKALARIEELEQVIFDLHAVYKWDRDEYHSNPGLVRRAEVALQRVRLRAREGRKP